MTNLSYQGVCYTLVTVHIIVFWSNFEYYKVHYYACPF